MELLPPRLPRRAARRRAAGVTTPDLVAAALCALLALPGLAVLTLDRLPGSPLVGLGLLVPGAVAVGHARLARGPAGPDIHDRQLDRIVAALAAGAAFAITAAAVEEGPAVLGSMLVLAVGFLAVAGTALVRGTRRLWQQRAAVVLLFAAWPAPWEALARRVVPVVGDPAATIGGIALAATTVAVLLAAGSPQPRHAARHAPVVPPTTAPSRPSLPGTSLPPVAPAVSPLHVAVRLRPRVAS